MYEKYGMLVHAAVALHPRPQSHPVDLQWFSTAAVHTITGHLYPGTMQVAHLGMLPGGTPRPTRMPPRPFSWRSARWAAAGWQPSRHRPRWRSQRSPGGRGGNAGAAYVCARTCVTCYDGATHAINRR